jgi:HK97 family phage prohead protease
MENKMLMTFNSEIKGIDEKEQTLTAYVSTGARDRMDEVLVPDGADMKNYKKNPIVLFAHKYDEPPIGKALWIKNDGDGILAKVKFASTAFAQEIFSLFKDGIMNAFSVGFVPKEWTDGDGEKKPRRTYTKWEMLEFSAVPVPANPEALMLAISKGLVLSDTMKKEFHVEETEPMEKVEEEPKNYMPEIKALQAEIEQAHEKEVAALSIIASLEKEISDLRYHIYELNNKPLPTPEISGKAIADMISEAVTGEIRRATGKV